jgi:hypothetical protein
LDLNQEIQAAKTMQDYFLSNSTPWTPKILLFTTTVTKALTAKGESNPTESL